MIILCKNGHFGNQFFQHAFTKKIDQKSIFYSCYIQGAKTNRISYKKVKANFLNKLVK